MLAARPWLLLVPEIEANATDRHAHQSGAGPLQKREVVSRQGEYTEERYAKSIDVKKEHGAGKVQVVTSLTLTPADRSLLDRLDLVSALVPLAVRPSRILSLLDNHVGLVDGLALEERVDDRLGAVGVSLLRVKGGSCSNGKAWTTRQRGRVAESKEE